MPFIACTHRQLCSPDVEVTCVVAGFACSTVWTHVYARSAHEHTCTKAMKLNRWHVLCTLWVPKLRCTLHVYAWAVHWGQLYKPFLGLGQTVFTAVLAVHSVAMNHAEHVLSTVFLLMLPWTLSKDWFGLTSFWRLFARWLAFALAGFLPLRGSLLKQEMVSELFAVLGNIVYCRDERWTHYKRHKMRDVLLAGRQQNKHISGLSATLISDVTFLIGSLFLCC